MANKVDEMTALGLSLRFDVMLEGVDLGTWSKVEGLDIKFDLCEYREGGKENNFRYYAPGLPQYTNVKMTRSLTAMSAAMVGNWIRKTAKQHEKGTGVITMYDAWTKPVFAWELIG
ncbi:MAG: phage tail protein, partial [Acidimicrobiales bacterium]